MKESWLLSTRMYSSVIHTKMKFLKAFTVTKSGHLTSRLYQNYTRTSTMAAFDVNVVQTLISQTQTTMPKPDNVRSGGTLPR